MTDQTLDGGTNSKVNIWFWVIGIAALLWNLLGLGAFGAYMAVGDIAVMLMSEAQKAEYQTTPIWVTIAFGVATIGGTLSSIALLMKKKRAIMLFLISFIAIIIQFVGGVIGSTAVADGGASALILPITIIIVGGFLWYYARKCNAKGWLS
jgi:hypothetical protein